MQDHFWFVVDVFVTYCQTRTTKNWLMPFETTIEHMQC